ncbi:MAG TPA: hypothetical protein VHM70_23190 [Polyangiaceae bacterium]|jgi:hypothetical protein|nr:hypothetical protein [Polyangiaceae bacterium]
MRLTHAIGLSLLTACGARSGIQESAEGGDPARGGTRWADCDPGTLQSKAIGTMDWRNMRHVASPKDRLVFAGNAGLRVVNTLNGTIDEVALTGWIALPDRDTTFSGPDCIAIRGNSLYVTDNLGNVYVTSLSAGSAELTVVYSVTNVATTLSNSSACVTLLATKDLVYLLRRDQTLLTIRGNSVTEETGITAIAIAGEQFFYTTNQRLFSRRASQPSTSQRVVNVGGIERYVLVGAEGNFAYLLSHLDSPTLARVNTEPNSVGSETVWPLPGDLCDDYCVWNISDEGLVVSSATGQLWGAPVGANAAQLSMLAAFPGYDADDFSPALTSDATHIYWFASPTSDESDLTLYATSCFNEGMMSQ